VRQLGDALKLRAGDRHATRRIRCATYTDVEACSALGIMKCDGAPSHIRGGLLRACLEVGHVLCGANTLTIPHPSRRVRHGALAALGPCNSFEERHDLVGYAMCIPSSVKLVACGTSRKPTHQRVGRIVERLWQLSGEKGRRSGRWL
jgi:hypothetical protein